METTMGFWPALGLMVASFAILAKRADWLEEGATGILQRRRYRLERWHGVVLLTLLVIYLVLLFVLSPGSVPQL